MRQRFLARLVTQRAQGFNPSAWHTWVSENLFLSDPPEPCKAETLSVKKSLPKLTKFRPNILIPTKIFTSFAFYFYFSHWPKIKIESKGCENFGRNLVNFGMGMGRYR